MIQEAYDPDPKVFPHNTTTSVSMGLLWRVVKAGIVDEDVEESEKSLVRFGFGRCVGYVIVCNKGELPLPA